MRDYIKNQLLQCQIAQIDFNETTYSYTIKKYTKPKYDIGHCYCIKVFNEVVNNPDSVLAINWNHGQSPKSNYYKAYVSKIIGKYIYVDCLAIDPKTGLDGIETFSGYLDINYIEQIKEL